jgi:ubiquinone/menaquinone biosynthesis C-methylase UbiE
MSPYEQDSRRAVFSGGPFGAAATLQVGCKPCAEWRTRPAHLSGAAFLTETAVQRFYRYHAYVYDSTRWMILHGRRRAVARLELRPDSQVLEVGCGTGLNFRHVLERLAPDTGHLTGLDFSADMLHRAARRVAARGWSNVDLVRADAAQMSLDRRFDAILFAYSLTMIPDCAAALQRAYEHLRVGGRLVVLDFGRFQRWGAFGALMRGWLRLNHVETLRPYEQALHDVCGEIRVEHWLGGYSFTAIGRRSA